MKAMITDIKRFAVHDGDGIRTTVFFKGCPLRCVWCHNPETLSGKSELAFYQHKCVGCQSCAKVCDVHLFTDDTHTIDRIRCTMCGKCVEVCPNDALKIHGKEMTVDDIMTVILQDIDHYINSGGGVTLSGGECLIQADFCAELLRECKANGINTAVDTCGYVSKSSIDKVMPYTDTFLYDLKAFDDDVHIKCTGVSNKIILENIKYIDSLGSKLEIRIPYVPELNDGEIDKLFTFIKTLKNVVRVRVLPYHNYAGSKYLSLGMENTMPEVRIPTGEEIDKIMSKQ